MNETQLRGRWKQIRGRIRERWGRLTHDDLDVIAGRRDQLVGRIQERYGVAREEAERQVEEFLRHVPGVSPRRIGAIVAAMVLMAAAMAILFYALQQED